MAMYDELNTDQLFALIREIGPRCGLDPDLVKERYQAWLAEKGTAGATFTADQRRWLDAVKDHIAASLRIEQEDFYETPFAQLGGLGRAHELFGDRLPTLLDEMNARLAA